MVVILGTGKFTFAAEFAISEVIIKCEPSEDCDEFRSRASSLIRKYSSELHFRKHLDVLLKPDAMDYFSYEVKEVHGRYQLQILVGFLPIIKKIDIVYVAGGVKDILPSNLLSLQEGVSFRPRILHKTLEVISSYLQDRGFWSHEIQVSKVKTSDGVYLTFNITPGKQTLIKDYKLIFRGGTGGSGWKQLVQRRILAFIGKGYDVAQIKTELDRIRVEFFQQGYYHSSFEFLGKEDINDTHVRLLFAVSSGEKFAFDFFGNKLFDRSQLMGAIQQSLREYKKGNVAEIVRDMIYEMYKRRSLFRAQIQVREEKWYDHLAKEKERRFFVTIQEGKSTSLGEIIFEGNNFFASSELEDLFYDLDSDIVQHGNFDEAAIDVFVNDLKKKYVEKGFIFVKVFASHPAFSADNSRVELKFQITEGPQVLIDEVSFEGVPDELHKEFSLKSGDIFNPLILDEKISLFIQQIREQGYYFAQVVPLEVGENLVYSADYQKVHLRIAIELGEKIILNSILLSGNKKTDPEIIVREVELKKGDILTPSSLQNLRSSLENLGLFSNILITPLQETIDSQGRTDLLISVQERHSIVLEVAPGYRTDLGLRLAGGVSNTNWRGRGKTLGLRGETNRRLNYSGLDSRRRSEENPLLEYDFNTMFSEPYIWGLPASYTVGADFKRKRFYSFDANIWRIQNLLTKKLGKKFTLSLEHQYEYISQFDATQEEDRGDFRIGALVPGIAFDWRNDVLNPSKGGLSALSFEYAHPYFFSQSSGNREINFYRVVMRNYFYIPFSRGTVAISWAAGLAENLSKNAPDSDGYEFGIPNIKVFRLSGIDNVRGFDDVEINRMSDGKDIREHSVTEKVYFNNLKIEPRYFFNDQVALGLFLDMGKLYLDSFNPFSFRSSVGLSCKYITPVGSISLDYGVKLHRKKLSDGSLESPGRLGVSIGFF